MNIVEHLYEVIQIVILFGIFGLLVMQTDFSKKIKIQLNQIETRLYWIKWRQRNKRPPETDTTGDNDQSDLADLDVEEDGIHEITQSRSK